MMTVKIRIPSRAKISATCRVSTHLLGSPSEINNIWPGTDHCIKRRCANNNASPMAVPKNACVKGKSPTASDEILWRRASRWVLIGIISKGTHANTIMPTGPCGNVTKSVSISSLAASILEGAISVALIDKETSKAINRGIPWDADGVSNHPICICRGYSAPAPIKEIITHWRMYCHFFWINDAGTTKGRCFLNRITPRPTKIMQTLPTHACGCPIYHVTALNCKYHKTY